MHIRNRDWSGLSLGAWRSAAVLLFVLATLRCGGPEGVREQTPFSAPELSLSPASPQIAQGTEQQFSLRSTSPDGRSRDVSAQVKWSVVDTEGHALPVPSAGLVQLQDPGRYQVLAEYEGRRVQTPIFVTTAALRSLSITPTAPRVAKGLTQQFVAKASFSDGTSQDVTSFATWSIKDLVGTGVAVITSTGLASARSVGKARITAKYMTLTVSATLEVTAAALKTLTLTPSTPSIAKGTTQRFVATGSFSDGTSQDVSALADWAVKDVMGRSVASIDGTGNAFGNSVGTATVSAEYLGMSAQTTLTVTPAAVVALALGPTSASIPKGLTQQFTATARFSDGTSQDVSAACAWTERDVSGVGVASVDGKGLASGNGVGLAYIYCAYRGYEAAATLSVSSPLLVSVAMTPASASVPKGGRANFTLTGLFSDGSKQDLSFGATWTATDLVGMDIVSVDRYGVVLGKNVGKAQIKAEYGAKSATATLLVDPAVVVELRISPLHRSIAPGATQAFKAEGTYSDGTIKDLTDTVSWSVTDLAPGRGVATINSSGLATGKTQGRARVEAVHLGVRAQTTLSVGLPVDGCSVDFWCWRNPLPQGNSLAAAWSAGVNDVWAVGSAGMILHWDGSAWAALPAKTSKKLTGVWGSDANNIWAVGDAGTVLHWDGSDWTASTVGFFDNNFTGIWGSDASHVWVISYEGRIYQWDGSAWKSQSSGVTGNLLSIWGADAKNVWIGTSSSSILKWDGSTWTAQASRASRVNGGWARDAANVWSVGAYSGVIQKWDGSKWVQQTSGTTRSLVSIWGSDTNNIWVAGENGTILAWNGTAWSAQPSGTTNWLLGLAGRDGNNVWAVGHGGTLLKWNGTAWSAQSSGSLASLDGIWGSDGNNIWAVGYSGAILKWNGTAWSTQASGTTEALNAVWGSSASSVWAVGNKGIILKGDGTTWSAQASGTSEGLHAVWGTDANNVWAVGSKGTILAWNGTAWSAQPSGITGDLYGIWGSDANNVWAVGDAILKWNGTAWSVQVTGLRMYLDAVWGTDANNVWVVGSTGKIQKWDGSSWKELSVSTDWLSGIWGTDANNIWVSTSEGRIWRWDGTRWTAQSSGSGNLLSGIWGSSANNIWTVGNWGTILQYVP